jgi:hypothetical protein
VMEDAVRSHAWIFDALGELIAAAPGIPRLPSGTMYSAASRPRFV